MKTKLFQFPLRFDESHKPLIDLILLRNYSDTFVAVREDYINDYLLL